MSSQTLVYLYSVTFFVVQEIWQTGTRQQLQCGQHLPHAAPALSPPQVVALAWQGATPGDCPKRGPALSQASPIKPTRYFIMVTVSNESL
jgi:hypothetical protein